MQKTPVLDFVYFDAGGGHKSAALALQSVIASQDYGWTVRLVNLQDVLDSLDVFRRITRIRMQDIYNIMLAKGWTLGSPYLLPMMHAIIRFYHSAQVKLLTDFWKKQNPDMVVSLVPNFNRAIFESLATALPGVPFVTILTDLADYPPHFWMEKQEQYLICGTERAVEQARALGHTNSYLIATSGMILRPQFYAERHWDRSSERHRLGLDPQLPTGLVLFGGEGSNVMFSIAERLGNSSIDLQLIMLCGRNKKLRKRLQQSKTRNRIFIEGFTRDIPYYMHLADFFIGKPGPGSISEALQMSLPVVLECNSWTLPQERYHAEWVREQKVGVVLENFRQIEDAIRELLSTDRLHQMKQKIGSLSNRAVFEIPEHLERILAEHAHHVQYPNN